MWTTANRARYNRDHLRYPSDLTDREWEEIEPMIPPAKRGCTRSDERHHVCIEHWVSVVLCAERFSVEEYAASVF
jgi:transposase